MSREKELSISTADSVILPNLEFLRLWRSQTFQTPGLGVSLRSGWTGAGKADLPKDSQCVS